MFSCSNPFGPLSESPIENLENSTSFFPTQLATFSPLQVAGHPRLPSLESLSRSCIMRPIDSQTKKGFSPKILVSNIEGARSKSAELSCLLEENKIDILLATETHLSSHVNSCEILPQNFLVYRKDRPSHKGGVLIAVNNNLVSIPRPGLDSDCEIIWCECSWRKSQSYLAPIIAKNLKAWIL
ncbi:predicted protein [Nematostella vectensis]|uniref:Endonuclease/exonuclease/phosphatase domain-containing protein n=1 Tax=Nematostella vectensis TaxID=45351 RepID=A7TCA8_NEMVE|nr:predicted protein [Nematostella vectensis]|eukprot:XP_001618426.1 hypothetical protein NEMVEDRAFT_v1g225164 [Nematostella vectensis]